MKSNASESGLPEDNGTPTRPLFRSFSGAARSPLGRTGLYLIIVAFGTLLLAGCDVGGERFSPSTPTRVQPTSTVPAATATDASPADESTATAVPTAAGRVLPVSIAAVPADLPEYDRGTWRHWTDEDGDCQNARQEVLFVESSIAVTFQTEDRCRVATGLWEGPYTGTAVDDPGDLDVDHMVPLQNAHRSGGWRWSPERKRQYANYLGYDNHLIATTSSANRSKGSKGPEEWRPPLEDYWCTYAIDWVSIKNEWGLTVTEVEYVALSEMLATCKTTVLLQPAQGTPPSPPTATVPPSLPVDLRYDPFGPDRDCGDFDTYEEALAFFLAAGGPGDDRHRLDVNGDGLPCESLPGGPSALQTHDGQDGLVVAGTSGQPGFQEDNSECVATGPPQPAPPAAGYAQSGCGQDSAPAAAVPALALPVPAAVIPPPVLPTPIPTPLPLATPRPQPTASTIGREPQPEAGSAAFTSRTDSSPVLGPEPTPVSPAFADLPFDPNGPDRNCGDFPSWWDAQNFYLASGGPANDPHRLDRNGDGTACESLLEAPGSDSGRSGQDSQPVPTATPQPIVNDFQDRNCSDFATWQEAQDLFLSEGGPSHDPHRLDRNGDGIACESLPGAPAPVPTATPQPIENEFEDRNCSDFGTWQEAQDFFLSEGGPSHDPHRLDRNGDGVACESLPGAPTPAPTATPQPAEDEFEDRNCSDFATWREAQDFFLAEGGPSQDPHRLDGDGNGVACQSLPGAPDG